MSAIRGSNNNNSNNNNRKNFLIGRLTPVDR